MEGCAMGQVLHGSATTTEAIRRAIQHSQESLRALAKRYGVNQKTVRKWKGRSSVADIRTGPTQPRSTVLSGVSDILCVGPVDHHAVTNRASNMMANCVFASDHSRGGIFQSAAT